MFFLNCNEKKICVFCVLLTEQLLNNNWLWFGWNIAKGYISRVVSIQLYACVSICLFPTFGEIPVDRLSKNLKKNEAISSIKNIEHVPSYSTYKRSLFIFRNAHECDVSIRVHIFFMPFHTRRYYCCCCGCCYHSLLFNLYVAFNAIWYTSGIVETNNPCTNNCVEYQNCMKIRKG